MTAHHEFLALGGFVMSAATGGWRLPDADADIARSFEAFARVVRRLEEGLFDAVFLNDLMSVTHA
ncbi:MAG: hypothetical protein QM690_22195, partial [Sphingobium sp.]